jgi:hypothetical protein
MRTTLNCVIAAFLLSWISNFARGDIVVGTDGRYYDGKITAYTDREIVIQVDGAAAPLRMERSAVTRAVFTDEHGAPIAPPAFVPTALRPPAPPAHWDVPAEPAAPPIKAVAAPSYYLIPLHGEVGATIIASALDKSLADAVARRATVVVLDVDSPGGSVDEALKIIKLISHYNRLVKIVVWADKDLSAAAILSLSARQIYFKPTGTFGAATAYIPGRPDLSAKVEEKMQSAWRAAARSSAEEGGHEPLLAEAMIDNTLELHLETVNGKPVVKEGPGDKVLCRKGRILTLTSHEAVECGLGAGKVEDLAGLGTALGYSRWNECAGLGTVLADYLPKRHDAFEGQIKKIAAEFAANIGRAKESDPSQEHVYVVPGISTGPHIVHGPQPIHRPGISRPGIHAAPQQVRVRRTSPKDWKAKSLLCVVTLQQAEANLRDGISLCTAFGDDVTGAAINNALTEIAAIRAKVYEERNRYGAGTPQVAGAPAPSPAPGPAAPAQTEAPAERSPAPSAAELAAAEATIRDIYRADFAKTKGADKVVLARTLLQQVDSVRELPSKFQLLVDARTLAAQAGDGATAMEAADILCKTFQVKPGEIHVAAVAAILASAVTQAAAAETSDALLGAAAQSVLSDEYDAALTLARAAEAIGRKSGSLPPVLAAQQKIKSISTLKSEAEKIKSSFAALEKNPNDGAANTAVGRFCCFVKNDWDHGILYLSKCSDTVLKDAATRDAAAARGTSVDQMGAADAWYNIASTVDATAKPFVQIHACALYANALSGLEGLNKAKSEKRIAELQKIVEAHADVSKMWTIIRKAVAAHALKKWDFIGGAFARTELDEIPPAGAVLVGFNCTTKGNGQYPGVVQAIYATPTGEILGRSFGKPEKGARPTTMRAKRGYAVGAIYVRGGGGFDAFQPVFMRITPDGLKVDDRIDGTYVGGNGGGDGTVGDGNFIVGLHLKIDDQDGSVMSLSIITTTSSPAAAISKPAPNGALRR